MACRLRPLNSLGFSFVRAEMGGIRTTRWKLNDIQRFQNTHTSKHAAACRRIVSLRKATMMNDVEGLCRRYDIDAEFDDPKLLEEVERLWEASLSAQYGIDFDDQIWMPVANGWLTERYDTLFVDESQDLSPIQMEFVRQISKRVIIVGDPPPGDLRIPWCEPQRDAVGSSRLSVPRSCPCRSATAALRRSSRRRNSWCPTSRPTSRVAR